MIGGGIGDAEPKEKGACSSHAPRSVQEAAQAALEYSVNRSMMSMAIHQGRKCGGQEFMPEEDWLAPGKSRRHPLSLT
jgi:hypothetical protein